MACAKPAKSATGSLWIWVMRSPGAASQPKRALLPPMSATTAGKWREEGCIRSAFRHPGHRMAESGVDIGDLARHAVREVRQQEGRHVAHVVDRHVAAQR